MALPDLNTYCVDLPSNDPLCITMPGGSLICAQFPGITPPAPIEFSLSLLGNLNGALSGLAPLFDILELLVALNDCMMAVEKCLGPPPNPSKLISCFPKLAIALAKVLQLLPPLSVPVMIAGILQSILVFLKGLRATILVILQKLLKLLSAQLRVQVTGSLQLQIGVDCATNNLGGFLAALALAAEPITCLIVLINDLLDLAGLPQQLQISISIGTDPSIIEAFLTPLDDIIAVLEALLALFPVGGVC